MHKQVFSILFALFLLLSCSQCKKDEIKTVADFDEYLEAEMEGQKIPALGVLLFKDGQILHEAYLGESNIEQNRALSANSLFLLASVSKIITATALMQLHEQGRFGLDEPINDYLPFSVAVPNYSTPITFRMLLTHTSGIDDATTITDGYYYGQDSPVALLDFMQSYLSTSGSLYDAANNFFDFEPGTMHEYSNAGSALIGVLVEQISGVEFNAYCKNNIFSPLGMTQSFWRLDEAQQSGLPLVQPYKKAGTSFDPIEHYTFSDYPNGGLRSSARDLYILLNAFAQGGRGANNHQLLNSATVQMMLSEQIPDLDGDMGLHIYKVEDEYGLWGHGGGEDGVATLVAFHPSTKIGVVLLANQEDADLFPILAEAYKLSLEL